VHTPRLRVSMVRNRSIMIHAGAGGPKVACGIIP
jgi:Cu/Zn superoxide dismutase